jgi:SAM-dependent methyltransferase
MMADMRKTLVRRLLDGLQKRGPVENLLDVGCNSGAFLLRAKEAGWEVSGYDPNPAAVTVARQRGLDVRRAWNLDECGFPPDGFQAITVIDVFCYSWHPFADLADLYRLLRPGGVLAMRLTNKRSALGLLRWVLPSGDRRDGRLSGILQNQFHSISVGALLRVLRRIGFHDCRALPHAITSPLRALGWPSSAAYLLADALYYGTLGRINLSPGILLFARKPGGQ